MLKYDCSVFPVSVPTPTIHRHALLTVPQCCADTNTVFSIFSSVLQCTAPTPHLSLGPNFWLSALVSPRQAEIINNTLLSFFLSFCIFFSSTISINGMFAVFLWQSLYLPPFIHFPPSVSFFTSSPCDSSVHPSQIDGRPVWGILIGSSLACALHTNTHTLLPLKSTYRNRASTQTQNTIQPITSDKIIV